MTEKGGGSTIGPTAAKLIMYGILILLGLWALKSIFGGPVIYTQQPTFTPIVQTQRGHGSVWYRDCAANGAQVTDLGGGVKNCYRPSRVETYIDGERVE